jgi:hypothetical protein
MTFHLSGTHAGDDEIMATEYPHTQLAAKNFPISQLRFQRPFVRAVATEKSGLSEDQLKEALDPARQAG